ncbi:MAG: hypothetical protein WA705_28480 [Candidatus Ozemobacteraceae bacterium]
MLIWKKSEPGSIREENQDVLLIRDDQGMAILADGRGHSGREAAGAAAEALARRLTALQALARPDTAMAGVEDAIRDTRAEIARRGLGRPGLGETGVDLAVAVIIEGKLMLGRTGPTGMLARIGDDLVQLEPVGLPTLAAASGVDPDLNDTGKAAIPSSPPPGTDRPLVGGPFPVQPGDWILVCSQGLLVSQPLCEIAPLAGLMHRETDDIAEALFRRAGARYDGDDRTLTVLRLLPNDLKKRRSEDVILETHIDKKFSMPLWMPLAAFATITVGVLAVWSRVRRLMGG